MWELREKKRKLEASIKDLEGQMADVESQLMERMEFGRRRQDDR